VKVKRRYIGALIGHPRSGTSYFKRVVNYASAVRPTFSHCYGSVAGRWDQKQAYADRFVFDCDCPENRVVLLERDASGESVQRAVTGLSFESLQQRDKDGFYSKAGNHYEKSGNDIRSLSFRSGKSGSWRDFPADFSAWRDDATR